MRVARGASSRVRHESDTEPSRTRERGFAITRAAMSTMSPSREAVFECTYASPRGQRIAHVRAWDAGEAADLFAHELAADGITDPGSISVRRRGDRRPRTAAYPRPAQ